MPDARQSGAMKLVPTGKVDIDGKADRPSTPYVNAARTIDYDLSEPMPRIEYELSETSDAKWDCDPPST